MEKMQTESEVAALAAAAEEEDVMLPGFRFHPTDDELVGFYLRRKVEKKQLNVEIIKEMDVYKHEPWELPKFMIASGEKEWYYFCRRGRKYRNSVRPNRVTGCGFWKATGIDRPIYSSGHCIGLKKSLVYYRGHAGKGTKTDWMMHEFRLPGAGGKSGDDTTTTKNAANLQEAEVWTICRILKRSSSYMKQPNSYRTSTPTKSAPESNGVTNCFESLDDCMCCTSSAGGGSAAELQLLQRHQNLDALPQVDVRAGHGARSLFPAPVSSCSNNSEMSPSSNDFMSDSIWDELGRISEFWADDGIFSSDECGHATPSYALEIQNAI